MDIAVAGTWGGASNSNCSYIRKRDIVSDKRITVQKNHAIGVAQALVHLFPILELPLEVQFPPRCSRTSTRQRIQVAALAAKHMMDWECKCAALFGGSTRKGRKLGLLRLGDCERIHDLVNGIDILSVVLYGCETWTLTLREEQRLRVFENKVLRKIFGAKRDEVTREWRKLHNTELHALYSSPDIIRNIKSRRLRWAGHVARMGESRNAYRVLVGRPEGKISLGRPRRRWEDNIKMDLREVGYDDREWINLAQDRNQWRAYVRAAMNLRVP
ncbi:hypothetical protein ANN_01827 [Periplaneta americana]|uniref:Endonuclease-reverse transcriptase n=1 Tax=Periplaneta americana TaxID=6978 RepID=A0ABQ8TUP7_PERAM|nr:hypothetical protein ANN_01827 [Periplaneta americana]